MKGERRKEVEKIKKNSQLHHKERGVVICYLSFSPFEQTKEQMMHCRSIVVRMFSSTVSNLQPLSDRVLVSRIKGAEKTIGGIFLFF